MPDEETLTALARKTDNAIAGAVLVALVGIPLLATQGKNVVILLIVLAAFAATVLLALAKTRPLTKAVKAAELKVGMPLTSEALEKTLWSRRVFAQSKFSSQFQKSVESVLSKIHGLAFVRICQLGVGTVSPDQVRVNVFLADTENARFGEIVTLRIPTGFHVNMSNAAERQISFRPNEGLTGLVYATEYAGAATRDSTGKWTRQLFEGHPTIDEMHFRITEGQIGLIDVKLRWILSSPLTAPKGSIYTILGVLNVDGVDFDLTEAQLREVRDALRSEAAQLSLLLSAEEVPSVHIMIPQGSGHG